MSTLQITELTTALSLSLGVYYSLTLGVTCSVTCTEVLVLELHFRSQAGEPITPRLVRLARWMAAVTLTRLDVSVKENTGVTWTLVIVRVLGQETNLSFHRSPN